MLKNVSSMKNMRFGFEESDEENNDMNPDWEDAFEKSGLGDKLREMNELQLEGADVYMSTFAALKNYPFFREVHNWFYPFSKQQSNVLKAMKQAVLSLFHDPSIATVTTGYDVEPTKRTTGCRIGGEIEC